MKNVSWRGLSILVFILVTVFFLIPHMPNINLPAWWAKMRVKLGLDLRGGVQMLYEVDISQFKDVKKAEDAVSTAIEIIRNRLDPNGVKEINIQKIGDNRIMIQIPGQEDLELYRKNINLNARLEFKLVAENQEATKVFGALDSYLSRNLERYPALAADYKPLTQPAASDTAKADTLAAPTDRDKAFTNMVINDQGRMVISYENVPIISGLLQDSTFVRSIPYGFQVALGQEDKTDPKAYREIYVLYDQVKLTGDSIDEAKLEMGDPNAMDARTARPHISFVMNKAGARAFADLTGKNVNKRLAILRDDLVYSAPVINERISGGKGQITGVFDVEDARDLTLVLNTGNLQAPIYERRANVVGASLGSDSIKSGITAGLVGFVAVFLFMLIYYKGAGFIANIALVLNIGFIVAVLAAMGAFLTLPGIAGIILTIGMAVDANVLIYERIKEELENGKTPRSAVDAGYQRATVTIIDSQITTLIAALVLYNIGSGPVRGFAVTLSIGIFASMFTAIVLCRAMFDAFVLVGNKKTMSI